MPHALKYDWEEIQRFYDDNHSLSECHEKFGFGTTARAKAVKAGRFTLRTHAEACAMRRKHDTAYYTSDSNGCSVTSIKGELACALLDARAIEKGLVCSRPNVECAYDRIIDDKGLHRVQVKFAGGGLPGRFTANISKTCRGRSRRVPYLLSEIDAIVIYSLGTNKLYWLPSDVWDGKMSLTLQYTNAEKYIW